MTLMCAFTCAVSSAVLVGLKVNCAGTPGVTLWASVTSPPALFCTHTYGLSDMKSKVTSTGVEPPFGILKLPLTSVSALPTADVPCAQNRFCSAGGFELSSGYTPGEAQPFTLPVRSVKCTVL